MALPEPKLDTDAKLSSLPDVSLAAEAPSTASPTDLPVESLAQLSAALSLLHPGEGDLELKRVLVRRRSRGPKASARRRGGKATRVAPSPLVDARIERRAAAGAAVHARKPAGSG